MVRKGQGILYKFEDGGVYNGRACITGVTRTSDRGGGARGGRVQGATESLMKKNCHQGLGGPWIYTNADKA